MAAVKMPVHGGKLQVTEVLAARSAQRREAVVHRQLVLLSRAMQAWFSWLGLHLADASAKQERLMYLQVSWPVAGCTHTIFRQTFLVLSEGEPTALFAAVRNTGGASLIAMLQKQYRMHG